MKAAPAQALLTVIITLRASEHYDMASRLRYRMLDTCLPDEVVFSVVDDASPEPEANKIESICAELGFAYHRIDSKKASFCAATARNFGASVATTRFIVHEDIDLFPYPGFYQDIIDEIDIQELKDDASRFITVPALYLSEAGTMAAVSGQTSKNKIMHELLTRGPSVTSYLPASSVILVDRLHYLSIGGYNERFNGWGLEDLEFAYRLTRANNTFASPFDHRFLSEGAFATETRYRGWRAQFRLHGELLGRKGTVIFHAHHPKDGAWRNKELHAANKRLFRECVEKFDQSGQYLPSLPMRERGKSLIFGRGTFAYNPALLPLWGDTEVKGYQDFAAMDIASYARENHIDRLIFTNPYANTQRLAVYNAARAAKIPYFVVERGALTDSMFIDDTGFCCESTRYQRKYWPEELDGARLKRVKSYIESEVNSSSALEKQGARLGSRQARQTLGISDTKRVLFIPFQSRSDTTVNYFAGDIGSFDNFVSLVKEVVNALPPDWVVVFKKHPLSVVQEDVPGAVDIGNMHIKDILDICDYVLLMNSGVGVLSLLFGKPVIYTAQAFYADDALNRKASSAGDVLSLLKEGFSVDEGSRLRFISYLLEDFYSFGKFTVREKQHTENAKLTITERIDYYRINLLGTRLLNGNGGARVIDVGAPIYDPFREWIVTNRYSEKSSSFQMPGSVLAIAAEARRLFLDGKYSKAAELFDEAAALLPDKATHYREAAEAYYRSGRRKPALARLKTARRIIPANKALLRRIRQMTYPWIPRSWETPFEIKE